MATWIKQRCKAIPVYEYAQGLTDDSPTVELLATGDSYPGDAISCSEGDEGIFYPDSDLDTTETYTIYIDGQSGYGTYAY